MKLIDFIWNSVVEKINGPEKVSGVVLKNVQDGTTSDVKTDGIFIFIGHDPNTAFLKGFVELDESGYVQAAEGMKTSVEGVFAAGEVRAGATKQLVAACGEGCEAALAAQAYLDHA